MPKSKKVYVLMFDDDGSKEKGVPIAVFKHRQSHEALMDYVPSESPADVIAMFAYGNLWYVSVHMA